MTDQFLAEIRIFPFNFPPSGWAFCHGQLMPLSQNTALFSLLGTTYGGDGKSTFALPDLASASPMHPGQGPGLSQRSLGEMSGVESITLLTSEIPFHTHTLFGNVLPGDQVVPGGNLPGTVAGDTPYAAPAGGTTVQLSPNALPPAGGGLPHTNMMPYLVLNFCIALQGVFPQRGT